MAKHKQFNSVIRDKTKELLIEYLKLKANTYKKISNETKLSETWIGMFSRGELKHTDIGRVETLYNYLSKTQIHI